MKKNSVRNAALGAAAAAVLLIGSAFIPSAISAAPADDGEAVLVSAAGNVIKAEGIETTALAPAGGPVVELAAVYYHGWYATKAKCIAARDAKLATGNYNFGGCNYYNQYPHKNTWQLWLDEDDCTDRIAPTSVEAAVSLRGLPARA